MLVSGCLTNIANNLVYFARSQSPSMAVSDTVIDVIRGTRELASCVPPWACAMYYVFEHL